MRRRGFTLIEVLIALGLASLLMASLFFWFRYLTISQKETKEIQWTLLEERYCDQQLSQVFSHVQFKERTPVFFSHPNSKNESELIFNFDNGPHINPLLAGTVLAQLYLDQKTSTLCLCVRPQEKQAPCEIFPLLKNITQFEIEFFQPPNTHLEVDPEKIDVKIPPQGWNRKWNKEFAELPSLIKIKILRPEDKNYPKRQLEFIYELPGAQKMVTFNEKGSV